MKNSLLSKYRKSGFKILFMETETFGSRLARLRISHGLTQKELAEKIGIGSTLISDYERGKLRLFDENIVKIAAALQISTDSLLGFNKEKQEPEKNSLRIMKRVKKIECLPPFKQKTILQIIDSYVKAEEMD